MIDLSLSNDKRFLELKMTPNGLSTQRAIASMDATHGMPMMECPSVDKH